jgi:hypothetical protein
MNFEQALDELKRTMDLSTEMLEPLGIPFDHFLHYCQMSSEQSRRAIYRLIARLEKKKKINSL